MEMLTPHEVLRLYEAVERTYGYDPILPRDSLLIELACARPRMKNYGDTLTEIAVFLEAMMNFRPFVAHNTATAFACFHVLLGMNNLRLAASPRLVQQAWLEWKTSPTDYQKIHKWLQMAVEPI
ncbi:MAG: hypothetical protein WAZ18_05885 [Alphaproteobacteria bacterium]